MTLTDKYSADFYVESLKILNSNFKDFSFAYFLIDEDNYSLKSAINSPLEGKKKYILKEEYVEIIKKRVTEILKVINGIIKICAVLSPVCCLQETVRHIECRVLHAGKLIPLGKKPYMVASMVRLR